MTTGANSEKPAQRRRRYFFWLRLAFLVGLLALVLCLLAVGKIATPDFISDRVRSAALAHGVNLRFKRLVWRWYRGIVAEQATIQSTSESNKIEASMAELVLDLNWRRLLASRQFGIDAIEVSRGQLTLPIPANNQPTETLEASEIEARLSHSAADVWAVEEFRGHACGATLEAFGTVTNATALFRQFLAKREAPEEPAPWQVRLAQFVRFCKQSRFDNPQLHFRFSGNLGQSQDFSANIRARVPHAEGPWGRADDSQLEMALAPDSSPARSLRTQFTLRSRRFETKSVALDNLELAAVLAHIPTNSSDLDLTWRFAAERVGITNFALANARATGSTRAHATVPSMLRTSIELQCDCVESKWASARSNAASVSLLHSITNMIPTEIVLESGASNIESEHGKIAAARLTAKLTPGPRPGQRLAESNGAWSSWLSSNQIELSMTGTGVESVRIPITQFKCSGRWAAPELHLQHLEAQLPKGTFVARPATLNIEDRRLTATFHSNFDPHSIESLLGDKAARWLQQFEWKQPPEVDAQVSATLPDTRESSPDWRAELLQFCQVDATLRGNGVSYRAVPIASAELKASISNEVLRLTDFSVVRPEGRADLEYQLDTRTREFNWNVNGSLNAKEIGPAISQDAPQLLSLFDFAGPTRVVGRVWGCWEQPRKIECALAITATNFSFRGEPVDYLGVFVRSSNKVVSASDVSVRSGNEWITAPAIDLDLNVPQVAMSNVQCCIDPLKVARAIGSNVVNAIEPYRFENPPMAHVSGRIAFPEGHTEPDIAFDVAGGPFHFWRLHASEVAGVVVWKGDTLLVTNLAASLYQGRLTGNVRAEFHHTNDTGIQFNSRLVNADLMLLARDLIAHSNRVEGIVTVNFDVASGSAADVRTWSGHGEINMRDGSLWDLPIFGILSPILNAVVPGLGNSKARSASATFTLDNGVLQTGDLAIDAGPARLRYRGKTDLEGRVDARVEAEILASTPLVGPFISLALTPLSKVFIFQVNGTLAKPQLEPVYVPRFLMLLLRPFQTLRNVLPAGPESTPQPNSPAEHNDR